MRVVPDNQNDAPNPRAPNVSNFKQQTMKAYKPVPTVRSAAIIFTVLGIIFIIVGAVLLSYSLEIIEYKERYDNKDDCKNTDEGKSFTCSVTFKVKEKMKEPVYFYYQLNNFYQNHRRYVKSKSADQLAGDKISKSTAEVDCDPIVTMKDLKRSAETLMGDWTESEAKSDSIVANPCGLIAKTFFNDTFSMYTETRSRVIIKEDDIAWQSDKDHKFKRNDSKKVKQWIDVEDGKV